MATDTASLKEYTLRLFAHRTMSNASLFDNPDAAPISFIRLYDSTGDYIEQPVMRSYNNNAALVFDDTGGSEADPEFVTVTQYYHDLDLAVEIPRFNKVFDVTANSWGYAGAAFSVADYELFNAAGKVIAEAADSTVTGFTVTKGQRYLLRFKIRVFNDMVEQTVGENTRSIITKDGLKTIIRRVVMNGSQHEYARAPIFVGVGSTGAYYISNGSDGRWFYDDSSTTYTSVSSGLFPPASAADDAFAFCREETTDDDIEGITFTLSTAGVLASGSSLVWEYYNTSSTWTYLYGVTDGTEQFQYSGDVRWEVPTDIATDAELKAGTVGRYYRCRLVGGEFTTEPTVAAATNIQPLVLRTVHTETDLQNPLNRKTADVVVMPATGHSAKVSAEFGLGGLVERTRADDGTLLSKSYEPVREVGIFSAPGVTEDETIELGSYTGAVASNIINIPTATNPAPIKLFNAIQSDGTIYNVNGRFVEYTVSGANYVTTIPLPDGTFTITYLGADITPSSTPQNILSVDGNVQNLTGPNAIWLHASSRNPADSDTGADTSMTPRYISYKGRSVYLGPGDGPMSPVLSRGANDRGAVVAATQGNTLKLKYQTIKYIGGETRVIGPNQSFSEDVGTHWAPGTTYKFRFTPGYPMVMARFDTAHIDRLNDPILVVSASGFVKYPEEAKFYYHVMIWSEGDPSSKNAHDRETGWKAMATSTPVAGSAGIPTNVSVSIPMKYAEEGNYQTSPYVNSSGEMYILVVASDKTDGDKSLELANMKAGDQGAGWVYDNFWHMGRSMEHLAIKRARQAFGDMGVGYIGLVTNPVGNAGKGGFSFRRGIDWTYYPGDAASAWRIDGTNGGNPENYAVTTRDGTAYLPVLPTERIGQSVEDFEFGALPAAATTTLYLQRRPLNAAGVYVWLEAEEITIDNLNGGITVNYVGWDSDAEWNSFDPSYSDDHLQSAAGGEGAGYVNLTFTSKDWSATEFRDVHVKYLYYDPPELTMTYLKAGGKMFARAHMSDMSHNTALNPMYGDKVRVYFEVQFEEKREA